MSLRPAEARRTKISGRDLALVLQQSLHFEVRASCLLLQCTAIMRDQALLMQSAGRYRSEGATVFVRVFGQAQFGRFAQFRRTVKALGPEPWRCRVFTAVKADLSPQGDDSVNASGWWGDVGSSEALSFISCRQLVSAIS